MTALAVDPTVGEAGPRGRQLRLPAGHRAIVEVAVAFLLPSVIFGTTLVQQESAVWQAAGQVMLWAAILAAAEVLVVLQGAGRTVLVLGGMILCIRVASLLLGEMPAITIAYEAVNGLLFALAGGAIVVRRQNLLYRQLRALLLISAPVMLLQLYGKPLWMQAWRTDEHGTAQQVVTTLFESDATSGFSTTQSRPAGVLHANNFLSIVLLYSMALFLGRSRDEKLTRTDVVFVVVAVLSMAKIVFVGFLVFSLSYCFHGVGVKRRRLLKLWGLFAVSFGVYYLLFPGVFLFDLSPNNAFFNYSIRVADLRAALGGLAFTDVSVLGFDGSTLSIAGIRTGSQSGYATLVPYLWLLLALLPFAATAYAFQYGRLRRTSPELAELAVNGLLVMMLTLLITPFWGNPFLAFAAGLALLPWLVPQGGDGKVSVFGHREGGGVDAGGGLAATRPDRRA